MRRFRVSISIIAIALIALCVAGCAKLSIDQSSVKFENLTLELFTGLYPNSGSINGPVLKSSFYYPYAIATDGTNFYVADGSNRSIRQISISTGEVSTLAGSSGVWGSADGVAGDATFEFPTGLAIVGTNLYVLDGGANTIRKIVIATGQVTTVAGLADSSGSTDGVGSNARFSFSYSGALTTDGTDLYVVDLGNSKIRKLTLSSNTVTTLAPVNGSGNPVSYYFNSRGVGLVYQAGLLYFTDGAGNVRSLNLSSSLDSVVKSGFNFLTGLSCDGTYLYVGQAGNINVDYDAVIFRVKISDQSMTIFAGQRHTGGYTNGSSTVARFNNPHGMVFWNGAIYLADASNNVIRKILQSDGSVSLYAGLEPTISSDGVADGAGSSASFYLPSGVVLVGSTLYVSDAGSNTIRAVDASTGVVTTIAGTPGTSGLVNATGTLARFNFAYGPAPLASDGTDLYVVDAGNSVIRKITLATGVVSTVAGTSGLTGQGLATVGANLFVTINNTVKQVVISSGVVTTLAGSGSAGFVNATGTSAQFNWPTSITTDGTSLYVADTNNNAIRKVVISSGVVTTVAGGSNGSNDGAALSAGFYGPYTVTYSAGNLYVLDYWNATVRKVDLAAQTVSSVTYFGYDELGWHGSGLASDGSNLYYALGMDNYLVKYSLSTKASTVLAGQAPQLATQEFEGAKGISSEGCYGLASDGTTLYCADNWTPNIRALDLATGRSRVFAGSFGWTAADGTGSSAAFGGLAGLAYDGANLYTCDSSNAIRKINLATAAVTTIAGSLSGGSGSADGTGSAAKFNFSYSGDIATDGTNLYVVDSGNNTIRKVVISSGAVTTLAGTAGVTGSADGVGAAAQFNFNYAGHVATDGTNLYVSDNGNHTIRKIVIATGAVTTVVGSAGVSGSTDGVGAAARLKNPRGLSIGDGALYLGDANNLLRKIDLKTYAVTTMAGTPGVSGYQDGPLSGATILASVWSVLWTPTGIFISDDYSSVRIVH